MSGVFDSNTLIYYLNAALPPEGKELVDRLVLQGGHISIITRIEILGWPAQSEAAYERASSLLRVLAEHPLTNDVADLCISLRQKRRIKIPDAVIAATAVLLRKPLITRNMDDFRGIPGLRLQNPFEPRSRR